MNYYIISLLMQKKLFLAFLLFCTICFSFKLTEEESTVPKATSNITKLIWPLPSSISLDDQAPAAEVDPCLIDYKIDATPSDSVTQILNIYLKDVFKCTTIKPGNIQLSITIKDVNQMVAEKVEQERYQLNVGTTDKWSLNADCYVGFLRGFETFSQLFEKVNGKYAIGGRPILIDDVPKFIWRGLMIDSSRHFVPVDAIKHTIDGLMFNKMTILHWHIIDEDSFPLVVPAQPDLANSGKLSGTYSQAEVRDIVAYAKLRGVRVIPEIDTPAHTESWGRSANLKDIIVKCNNNYNGQFDPTLDLTYNVVTDVMKEINNAFIDNYAHFGGDEINAGCYNNRPSIKEWMIKNNISDYTQLSIYYRQRQKVLWRNITKTKKAVYWANEGIDFPLQADDVLHWWGYSGSISRLAGRPNEVILSNYEITYLDLGFGGATGQGYGGYLSWRNIYRFEPRVKDVNVIGGVVCMWAETANAECMDQKVFTRAAPLNERLWNPEIDINKDILNIASRLIAQTKRMKERGFKVNPVTVGLCEKDPSMCFA